MRVRTIKLEYFAGPTSASGDFDITGNYEADVSRAVREVHYCEDDGCDIREAWEADCTYSAAYLLYGATECPALDAVRWAYSLRAEGIPVDFASTDKLPDWDAWLEHHMRYGVHCDACGSYTFGSDYYTPEQCANCLTELPTDDNDNDDSEN